MRILGLDIGKKRIGIALTDPLGITAQAVKVIERQSISLDIERIKDIIGAEDVEKIVLGIPLDMQGRDTGFSKIIREFAEQLKSQISLPLDFYDERFTTLEAERLLLEADISRKKRRGIIDKLSAQIILQGYLESSLHYSQND